MSNRKKGYLSIGLVLAFLAWSLIALFTYFGILLDGRGAGVALGGSAGVLILGFGCILLAIKAKTARTDASGWGLWEYFCLAVSIGAIVFAGYYSCAGMKYIGSVNELKNKAVEDIRSGVALVSSFRSGETSRLMRTETGLRNMLRAKPSAVPYDVQVFLRDNLQTSLAFLSTNKVDMYVDIQKSVIEHGSHTDNVIGRYIMRFDSLSNVSEEWYDVPAYRNMGSRLSVTLDSLGIVLTSLSQTMDYPEIVSDASGYHLHRGAGNVYRGNESGFMSALNNVYEVSWVSIAGFVILAVFALLDYFMEFRRSDSRKKIKLSESNCLPL